MSVLPFPNVVPSSSALSFESNTDVFVSPITGAVQTLDRGGERWHALLTFTNAQDADRARLQSLPTRLNGQQHRVSLEDHSYTIQGSLTVTELITNSDFSDGVNNWASGSNSEILAVYDGLRYKETGPALNTVKPDAAITTVIGKSYSWAADFLNGYFPTVSTSYQVRAATTSGGNDVKLISGTANEKHERLVLGVTAVGASTFLSVRRNANDWNQTFDINRASFARAFLVDNGYNVLQESNTFDNGDWAKQQATIIAGPASPEVLAADQSATADEFIEDATASSTHYILQTRARSSVQEYWTGSVDLRANTNQRIRLSIADAGNDTNAGWATFDATSGTITGSASAGGSATNPCATIHLVETGLYRCRISVRLAATANVSMRMYMCDGASNTITYNGDNSSSVYISDAQLQLGGQLGRRTRTTTAGVTGTNQTGNEIWLKGLDNDSNAQLAIGDQMEINGQLVALTADLDGDESGVGLARIRPGIRTAPSDEDPVVLHRPKGTFLLSSPRNTWRNVPGVFSNFSFDFVEDITA